MIQNQIIICIKSWILEYQFSRLFVKVSRTVLQYEKVKDLEIQMCLFHSPTFGWVSFCLNCVLVSPTYRPQKAEALSCLQQHQSGSSLDILFCPCYSLLTAKHRCAGMATSFRRFCRPLEQAELMPTCLCLAKRCDQKVESEIFLCCLAIKTSLIRV